MSTLKNVLVFSEGFFLWELVCLDELCVSKELSEALTEGLTALTRQNEVGNIRKLLFFKKAEMH